MQVVSKYGILAVIFSMLAGCASSPSVPFSGSTVVSKRLSHDVYKMLALYTSAQGCKKVDAVYTTVIEPPAGALGQKKSKERWTLSGCNQQFPYAVSLREDGTGGTYFSVSKD